MKVNYLWSKGYSINEISIHLHPDNKLLATKIESIVCLENRIEVINPRNKRLTKLNVDRIFIIEAMDNLSKVYTVDNEIFFVKGRLKDLEKLQLTGMFRINNSVILNIEQIESFQNGKYARLEVYTRSGQSFIVSRHYAKKIREELG